jgi:GNAT superfamily N-acetyltransferase
MRGGVVVGRDLTRSDARIETFSADMTPEVVRLLARAFVANPLHVATFGLDRYDRNERFFRIVLRPTTATRLVATDGSRILGFINWIASPDCQPSGFEKVRSSPAMLAAVGISASLRLASWLSTWSQCEPAEPHFHLGPIGVDPEAQGQHIGRRLMTSYCETLDRTGMAGYLETDRAENVRFYRHFGFGTTREVGVSGIPNFLMQREPAGPRMVQV